MNIIILSLSVITLILSLGILLTYDTNPAYAQDTGNKVGDIIREGSNYKETLLATNGFERTIKWESKPAQVFDGSKWENYVYSDSPTKIRFESEGISIDFFKDTCSFKLYKAGLIGAKVADIESVTTTLKRDGIDISNPSCIFSPVVRNDSAITFDKTISDTNSKLVTRYEITYLGVLKYTHEPENIGTGNATLTIVDSCFKCDVKKTEGDRIEFGEYTYDTENRVHNKLKEHKKDGNNYNFTYEVTLEAGKKEIIDPTFTGTPIGTAGRITGAGASCVLTNVDTLASTLYTWWNSASANGCAASAIMLDVSSIPDAVNIINSSFSATTQSVSIPYASNDLTYIRVSSVGGLTGAEVFDLVQKGTIFVSTSKWTTCAPCLNEDVDLGTTADSNFQTAIQSGNNTIGIGFIPTTRTRDGNDRQVVLTDSTLRMTLTYLSTITNAGPPVNFTATDNQVMQINVTWNTNNATGVEGYSIWNSTTNSTVETGWQSLVITSNFTGNQGFYTHTSLLNGSRMYYRVAAMAGNNGTNATGVGYTADIPSPPSLTALTFSSSRIDYISTAGSDNGNSTVKDYGLQCEVNSAGGWLNTIANSTLPANRSYNYTGLSQGDTVVCQWRDGNSVGFSDFSANATGTTFQNLLAFIIFQTNRTGDTLEIIPNIRLSTGIPSPTMTNIQILRNNTSVNNTAISIPISVGETKSAGRSFIGQLDSTQVYNITGIISIQNITSTYTFTNYTELQVVYTSQYFTSSEGNHQVNYTTSRTNSYQTLNLVVNRQNLPANTECNFKDELFEIGTWINITNSGWYNTSLSVAPTQDVYVTCYNDQLLFGFASGGGNNATLAFVDYMNQMGTFAGVPIPFLFVLLFAALFTGRSAITGIIFVTITIGVMGAMGFLPDINGDPAVTGATWSLIILLTSLGVFVGKKYF